VAGIAIFVSLPAGIGAGMVLAILMFIRSNIKQPIRQVVHADRRTSRKVRPTAEAQMLRDHGKRIVLIELDGALFFGTAETADEQIERFVHVCDYIVLDFQRVTEVDASGARVLLLAADAVDRAGKLLLLSGLSPGDARTRMIRDMDVHGRFADEHFFDDIDHALEYAEDRLLAGVACTSSDCPALTLAEVLGASFEPQELEVLDAMLTERKIAKGELIFRDGDPGNAMYLLLRGQVGIRVPATEAAGETRRGTRLVSYAPGVMFGEMAMLAGTSRSADAIAEADTLLLELKRADYERLQADHPALLGKLLLNIGLLLASRVRSLTDELRATQSVR
jgi:sulfate permease, SulP family